MKSAKGLKIGFMDVIISKKKTVIVHGEFCDIDFINEDEEIWTRWNCPFFDVDMCPPVGKSVTLHGVDGAVSRTKDQIYAHLIEFHNYKPEPLDPNV